jgi:hypothetical protein
VTLRADIHSAMDQAVSPAPWLAGDIGDSIRDTNASRNGRGRSRGNRLQGFRGFGAMAAVMIAILLVAGTLVGGQLLRDWRSFGTRISPAQGVDPGQLSALRSRPVQLPSMPSGLRCASPSISTIGYLGVTRDVLGSGPVYLVNSFSSETTSWGTYWDMTLVTSLNLKGPILIRGENLSNHTPIAFIGQYATGQVLGSEVLDGTSMDRHAEVVLDASHPPSARSDDGSFAAWVLRDAERTDTANYCIGWQLDGTQLDGTTFTETIIYNATYPPPPGSHR